MADKVAERNNGGGGGDGSVDPRPPPPPQGAQPPSRTRPMQAAKGKSIDGGNSCGFSCLKYSLFVVNLLVWLLGLAIVIVSAIALAGSQGDEAPLPSLQSVRQAAATALFLGCLLFVVGFLGCCGSLRESSVMLTGYFVILLLVVVFEIAIMALAFAYVNSSQMEESINNQFKDIITGGRKDKDSWQQEQDVAMVYNVQANLRCCGGRGTQDYIDSSLDIPQSCYDNRDNQRPVLYQTGCSKALKDYVLRNGLGIGLVNLFSLFVEIVAMVCSCLLIQGIKKSRKNASAA